jgi:aspartate/methionine/tyrosine aminotransferase
MKQEYNLSWGDPFCVRQSLMETLGNGFSLAHIYLENMGYPPHSGTPKLIEQLKDLALRQSGHRPKHLVVTVGATGALNAALYALKTQRTDWVVTNKRYYPILPAIIGLSDMAMVDRNYVIKQGLLDRDYISLIDSPSAPEGLVFPFEKLDIWDSAYASRTYGKAGSTPTSWKVMAGSLSKTTGLAGLRLGWASTDDDELAKSIARYVTANNAGISSISQGIAEEVLDRLDLDRFEKRSSGYLDNNREEMQKLLTKFGAGDVPSRGMFCIIEMGKIERKVLERAGIKWQAGSSWGESDSWARLSLGQSREVVKAAVKAALK